MKRFVDVCAQLSTWRSLDDNLDPLLPNKFQVVASASKARRLSSVHPKFEQRADEFRLSETSLGNEHNLLILMEQWACFCFEALQKKLT